MNRSVIVFYTSLLSLSLILFSCSETPKATPENPESQPKNVAAFDSVLAAELGADNYGMKTYILAFLKAGPNRDQDSTTAAGLQKAHMQNIRRMAEEGTLVLAGPFLENEELRGIYIFNVSTIEEAEALTNTDPAVQAGRLVMELHPWYGTAALGTLNEVGKTLARKSF